MRSKSHRHYSSFFLMALTFSASTILAQQVTPKKSTEAEQVIELKRSASKSDTIFPLTKRPNVTRDPSVAGTMGLKDDKLAMLLRSGVLQRGARNGNMPDSYSYTLHANIATSKDQMMPTVKPELKQYNMPVKKPVGQFKMPIKTPVGVVAISR